MGGGFVPDGVLHIKKENSVLSYLVESKCYSNGFKIFDEVDKGSRYVERFVENLEGSVDGGYDLRGYIFLAHSFDRNRMDRDIEHFRSRTEGMKHLDILCASSEIMKTSVEKLSYLYRRQPSATYRIFSDTKKYSQLVDGLARVTNVDNMDLDAFENEIIRTMIDKGHKESKMEERIREGLTPPPVSWEKAVKEAGSNIPNDYPTI